MPNLQAHHLLLMVHFIVPAAIALNEASSTASLVELLLVPHPFPADRVAFQVVHPAVSVAEAAVAPFKRIE